jgi:hypothetical protein
MGRAIGRVLQVRLENIWKASRRRTTIESSGSSCFSSPKRKKRADLLDPSITAIVKSWSVKKTRVSPCRKDTKQKFVKRNTYVLHHIHLHLETLVRLFCYPVTYFVFVMPLLVQ